MTKAPVAAVILGEDEDSTLPALFDYWLRATGRPGKYLPLYVEPEDLSEVLHTLPKAGFVGVHLGNAFQKMVLEQVDIISDRAALMGGANTLIFRADGKLHADNTFGYGFIENLRASVPDWSPQSGPVALFGAGRVARVVVTALIELGVQEIRISARNRAGADELRREFGTRIEVVDWLKAGNIAVGAVLAINATPLGTEGHPEFRVPLDGLARGAAVYDLVVSPGETRFLSQGLSYGGQPVFGPGMMVAQAMPSFERWFGARPPLDDGAHMAILGL